LKGFFYLEAGCNCRGHGWWRWLWRRRDYYCDQVEAQVRRAHICEDKVAAGWELAYYSSQWLVGLVLPQ
jgi:hypothetical protein